MKGINKLGKVVFFGLLGLIFAWIPLVAAAYTSFTTDISLVEAIRWEWASWVIAIQEAAIAEED